YADPTIRFGLRTKPPSSRWAAPAAGAPRGPWPRRSPSSSASPPGAAPLTGCAIPPTRPARSHARAHARAEAVREDDAATAALHANLLRVGVRPRAPRAVDLLLGPGGAEPRLQRLPRPSGEGRGGDGRPDAERDLRRDEAGAACEPCGGRRRQSW